MHNWAYAHCMTNMKWLTDTIGDDSVNAAALKAQINQSTLSRQIKSGRLTPETVVALASAYERDVLDALVVAGLITHEHIKQHGVREALSAATDKEIADEVWKRLNDGQEHGVFDEAPGRSAPSTDAATEQGGTVHAFPSRNDRSAATVTEPQVIAAMENYEGEDLVAEMEGHEEYP